jgi:micrococcal nuclease
MVNKFAVTTALVASLAFPLVAPSTASAGTSTGTVVRVDDGDSVRVEIDGILRNVRLIGVDAPEADECFYAESKQFLESLLAAGTSVRVQTDRKQPEDGRLFAYVSADRDLVNHMSIRLGYARERAYGMTYRKRNAFLAAQEDAQAENLGLWATC